MAVGRGLFISFEGGEGTGKTTQAQLLARHLESKGARVVLTREPGGTPLGERVREILLHALDVPLSPEAQALLFSAARAELVRSVIRPALAEGAHVVAGRFFDSTLAYQGYGHGVDLEALRAVTRVAVGDTVPDLTLLLDLPTESGLARKRAGAERWDRFEADDEAFHRRVREGYLALARAEPQRFVMLAGDRPEGEIAREVAARVDALLSARAPAATIRAR